MHNQSNFLRHLRTRLSDESFVIVMTLERFFSLIIGLERRGIEMVSASGW